MSLMLYGKEFFANHVTHAYDLARGFAELLKNDKEFELAVEPQSNIVCFRYLLQHQKQIDINVLQAKIRNQINQSGKFYIVKTTFNNILYLRISLMNPMTTLQHLKKLVEDVKAIGNKILNDEK